VKELWGVVQVGELQRSTEILLACHVIRFVSQVGTVTPLHPTLKNRELYSRLHLHSIHSLQKLVSQRRYLERQKPTAEARGKIRGR
jgi:hypothetical protein